MQERIEEETKSSSYLRCTRWLWTRSSSTCRHYCTNFKCCYHGR